MSADTRGQTEPHTFERLRATEPRRHVLVARLLAGVPLLLTSTAQMFVPEASLRVMVDAAGFPLPALVTPFGIAAKFLAGLLLVLGLWARIGALVGIAMMLGALYAHLVIDFLPNGADVQMPPLALPFTVLLASVYVLWRGAGRWSLDRRTAGRADAASGPS